MKYLSVVIAGLIVIATTVVSVYVTRHPALELVEPQPIAQPLAASHEPTPTYAPAANTTALFKAVAQELALSPKEHRADYDQTVHHHYSKKILSCIEQSAKLLRGTLTIKPAVRQGYIQVAFVLDKQARIKQVELIHSCGDGALDSFILTAINHASTSFPPLPALLRTKRDYLGFNLKIPLGN